MQWWYQNSSTANFNSRLIRCQVSNEWCINKNPWEGTEIRDEHPVTAGTSNSLWNDDISYRRWHQLSNAWVVIHGYKFLLIEIFEFEIQMWKKVIERQYFFTFFSRARFKSCSWYSLSLCGLKFLEKNMVKYFTTADISLAEILIFFEYFLSFITVQFER